MTVHWHKIFSRETAARAVAAILRRLGLREKQKTRPEFVAAPLPASEPEPGPETIEIDPYWLDTTLRVEQRNRVKNKLLKTIGPKAFEELSDAERRASFDAEIKLILAEEEDGLGGRFKFKDTILDQLDYYFKCMQRLKRTDRDSYDLFSRVGINMVPDRTFWDSSETFGRGAKLSPWFAAARPGYGAYALGAAKEMRQKSDDGTIPPRLVLFQKYKPGGLPGHVHQPVDPSSDLYMLTLFYHMPETSMKRGAAWRIPIELTLGGDEIPLRILVSNVNKMRHKRRRDGEARVSTFTTQEWRYSTDDWDNKKLGPVELARALFRFTAASHEHLNSSMIRVAVDKGSVSALMNVDTERTPYFFKDREPVVIDGVTKRIFHIVRPHERVNGSAVKMHFRGLRDFRWNNYRIRITTPGWHHGDMAASPYAAVAREKLPPDADGFNTREVGDIVRAITRGEREKAKAIFDSHEERPRGEGR